MHATTLHHAITPAALLLCALDASAAAPTDAGGRRVLLDRQLRAQTVDVIGFDSGRVTYVDENGRRRESSPGEILALVPASLPPAGDPAASTPEPGAPAAPTPAHAGVLELLTGERYPGDFAGGVGAQDSIIWRHPRLGRFECPLDAVARAGMTEAGVRFIHAPVPPGNPAATLDRVLLLNGDRLDGYLVSFSDTAEMKIDGESRTFQTPLIAGLALAGGKPERMHGQAVWLEDGTVARVASARTPAPGAVMVSLEGGQSASYPWTSLIAVAFDAGALLPLASIEPRDQQPIGERPMLDPLRIRRDAISPAPINAWDIELPGPMRVAWAIPQGASRLACLAELPKAAMPWGDCELVLTIDGKEAFRRRLHQGDPSVEINIPLTGKELAASVEPGNYGPINDRVFLRRALFLTPPK